MSNPEMTEMIISTWTSAKLNQVGLICRAKPKGSYFTSKRLGLLPFGFC